MAHFETSAICSPLTLASEIGREVLLEGGNAVDAAIATNLVLAVAYPHMCGVGGDVLAMVWRDGDLVGLNSSGGLPARASLPSSGVPLRGIGSATVPGAAAGWRALAERFGTRSLGELARPAIDLALRGVERPPSLLRYLEKHEPLLDETASEVFLGDGPMVQTDLATTLGHLDDFYAGPVATNAPAPFTADDFAAHVPEWVTPVTASFAGVRVCEMPPKSRGYLALEAIRRLEPLDDLDPNDRKWHERLLRSLAPALRTGDTIYLCCVDSDGLAVSLNQSLYEGFGSGVMIPGTGVLLHNRGSYHTEASYRPRARPVHTLSPAMVMDKGRPLFVLGTMGGDAQIQIHLQLLARILVAGEDVEAAIAAPRWTYGRGELIVEEGLPDLTGILPDTVVRPPLRPEESGHAHCIRITEHGLEGAADPRSDGVPVGF